MAGAAVLSSTGSCILLAAMLLPIFGGDTLIGIVFADLLCRCSSS